MSRRIRTYPVARVPSIALLALLALAASDLRAQAAAALPAADSAIITLKQAFAAAWARQPQARSIAARREAAEARRQIADGLTAEPPSLELSGRTGQFNRDLGGREYIAGIALPLWLPGERARTAALAEAELRATASQTLAAQLRTASTVREAWWDWQRARSEQALARERLTNAQQFAADVARRERAGDLARADLHQAEAAVASAEIGLAAADATLATATQRLRALVGTLPGAREAGAMADVEPLPAMPADDSALDVVHPAIVELRERAEAARRSADLSSVQTRSNPELTLATTRERGVAGDPYQQTLTLGVRVPFGSAARTRAKAGLAHAEAIEAEAQLQLERERLVADVGAAHQRVDAARTRNSAAQKRAQLARDVRGYFDKSFRLGETDLPTRLRIELESAEAERQAVLARIDLAAAVSTLRQAMGLLPEQE